MVFIRHLSLSESAMQLSPANERARVPELARNIRIRRRLEITEFIQVSLLHRHKLLSVANYGKNVALKKIALQSFFEKDIKSGHR